MFVNIMLSHDLVNKSKTEIFSKAKKSLFHPSNRITLETILALVNYNATIEQLWEQSRKMLLTVHLTCISFTDASVARTALCPRVTIIIEPE